MNQKPKNSLLIFAGLNDEELKNSMIKKMRHCIEMGFVASSVDF
jgi:hypothetical protein